MFAFISNVFGYLLDFLYNLVNNYGIAIILFSILLRIILLPITIKQQRSLEKTNKIQGQLKSLQFKYKNNPEMLNKETMELYKREKISPFSGCLSGIVQILIILSVFYLVSQPLTYMKKANDNNPELKAVVEEYKNELKDSGSNKTRYIEIATIARIRDEYNNVSDKLNKMGENNSQENISAEQNNESGETPAVEETQNAQTEQTAEGESPEKPAEEVKVESKEELEKKKGLLEKLNINMYFMGLDLSKVPTENLKDITVYIIPLLYVVSSFVSIRLTSNMQNKSKKKEENGDNKNEEDAMAQMGKGMTYMLPIMTLSIAFIAPLGLALYWFVSNVLMIAERVIIKKIMENQEAK